MILQTFILSLTIWTANGHLHLLDPQEHPTLYGINWFSHEFYSELARQRSGQNLVTSALSVHYLLTLIAAGSPSDSANFVEKLHLPYNVQNAFRDYQAIKTYRSRNTSDVVTYIANRIYVKSDLVIKESYWNQVINLDPNVLGWLRDDPASSVEEINQWIEEKTDCKITDFVSERHVDGTVKLFLVNAIYFKAKWKYPFRVQLTRPQLFYYQNKAPGAVLTMRLVGVKLEVANDKKLNAVCVRLPYKEEGLRMTICKPLDTDLARFENDLRTHDLNQLSHNEIPVILELPKFQIASDMDLGSVLMNLGILGTGARMTGISDDEDLRVSGIKQRAYISVDEEGSEAAAATGMDARMLPPTISMNTPFYYAIETPNMILFQGRVYSP